MYILLHIDMPIASTQVNYIYATGRCPHFATCSLYCQFSCCSATLHSNTKQTKNKQKVVSFKRTKLNGVVLLKLNNKVVFKRLTVSLQCHAVLAETNRNQWNTTTVACGSE